MSLFHVSQILVVSPHTLHILQHHSGRNIYIHLMYLPLPHYNYWENISNRSVSSYKRQGLLIIYSPFLGESMSHKIFLVFLDVAICSMFDLVDPLGRHYKLIFRSRDQIQDIILHDRLVLFDHSILPLFLLDSFFIVGRLCINDVTYVGRGIGLVSCAAP